jgi:protein-S-isoprenylcysteine O-methyltransferase Ste14
MPHAAWRYLSITRAPLMSLRSGSIVATAALVLAVVGLLASHALLAGNPAAVGLQGGAALLMLWARVAFGARSFHAAANPTEGGLVTTGPYRYVRHPIYAAVLLFLWAGVATHASPLALSLAVLASAAVAVRILAEERLVVARYPEYAAYAAGTKRLIPFVL